MRLRLITTVRAPLARVLSEYRHVCASGKAWDYAPHCARPAAAPTKWSSAALASAPPRESAAAQRGFVEFLKHAKGMRNRQARFLAGVRRG